MALRQLAPSSACSITLSASSAWKNSPIPCGRWNASNPAARERALPRRVRRAWHETNPAQPPTSSPRPSVWPGQGDPRDHWFPVAGQHIRSQEMGRQQRLPDRQRRRHPSTGHHGIQPDPSRPAILNNTRASRGVTRYAKRPDRKGIRRRIPIPYPSTTREMPPVTDPDTREQRSIPGGMNDDTRTFAVRSTHLPLR